MTHRFTMAATTCKTPETYQSPNALHVRLLCMSAIPILLLYCMPFPSCDAHHIALHNILVVYTSRNKGHLDIATEVKELSYVQRNYTRSVGNVWTEQAGWNRRGPKTSLPQCKFQGRDTSVGSCITVMKYKKWAAEIHFASRTVREVSKYVRCYTFPSWCSYIARN